MTTQPTNNNKVDVLATRSDLKGVKGQIETMLRRFRNVGFLILFIPLIAVCLISIGISLSPAIWIITYTHQLTISYSSILKFPLLGISIAVGFFSYGLSLLLVLPLFNLLIKPFVKPFRGAWYSFQSIPWYIHNALTYVARYTFLDFITPSPLNIFFYRMMGMKIGRNVMINTSNISDPCMITLEDHVVIGGSVHLMAHYGQKGFLVIAPVIIGRGTNVGLKASIMGDVIIGKNVNIKPHTVVFPKTRIPDDTTLPAS